MEYKVCENCGEKLHVRTQKCPFCNTVLTEKSEIITEDIEEKVEEKIESAVQTQENETSSNNGVINDISHFENEIVKTDLPDKEVKDYVYKAEVRHSLEYTKLMPNALKVFLTAVSMIPVVGQIIGTFFGVFFLTYEDNDRKSFGRSLIGLSIIMFLIYAYNVIAFSELVKSEGLSNLISNI